MVLPPGVSASDFSAALQQFQGALGKEWVFTDPDDVGTYIDAYSPAKGEAGERFASAGLAPNTVEQVQAVVQIANKYKVPIYPISTGRNLGYGGAAPILSGSVMVDLRRMNRVLEVNEAHTYCLVEAGVSYFDLAQYIRDRKLNLWPDLPNPGWGSPVGNALDRGVGRMRYRDHIGSQAGIEAVLPNGELVRTGMGSLPNSPLWHLHPHGFGPSIEGLFPQGNFGIVTKMGFRMQRAPEAYTEYVVTSADLGTLNAVVEAHERLFDDGIHDCSTGIGTPLLSSQDPEVIALHDRPGDVSDREWNELGKRKGIPCVSTRASLYGPSKLVDAMLEVARDRYTAIPGVDFKVGVRYKFPDDYDKVRDQDLTFIGVPQLLEFTILGKGRKYGHYYYSPLIPMTGDALLQSNKVLWKACRDFGAQWRWSGAVTMVPRSMMIIYAFYVSADPAENKKNRDLLEHLVRVAADHGWAEYRTGAMFQDTVSDVFSFNNHAMRRTLETIKDALDPNGILAAGRGGIWPKHLRKAKA